MNLNEVRTGIKNVKVMITDMIAAGEITVEQANSIAPIIVESIVKNESVGGDYTAD